jgi:hypothetical protein
MAKSKKCTAEKKTTVAGFQVKAHPVCGPPGLFQGNPETGWKIPEFPGTLSPLAGPGHAFDGGNSQPIGLESYQEIKDKIDTWREILTEPSGTFTGCPWYTNTGPCLPLNCQPCMRRAR